MKIGQTFFFFKGIYSIISHFSNSRFSLDTGQFSTMYLYNLMNMHVYHIISVVYIFMRLYSQNTML